MINSRTYGFAKTDAEELVQLIGGGDAEYAEMKPKGGGGASRIVQVPSGGIAARSGTTVASASCTVFTIVGTTLTTASTTLTVFNLSTVAIPANMYIVANKVGNAWIAEPGVVSLRFSSPNLQLSLDTSDAANWTTWHTAGIDCPP